MDNEKYKHKVREQLLAYDFVEISAEDIEEGDESINEDDREIIEENELFMRDFGSYTEGVLIAQIRSESVEDLKSLLIEFIEEDESELFHEEYRVYILLISESATKAMKTVAKRYAVEEWPRYILPVLVGIKDESFTHHEKTGILKSATTLHSMEKTAAEYFTIQE